MIALRGAIHVACFHHSCFCKAFGDASSRRGDWEHATLLFCAGVLAFEVRGKGVKDDEKILDARSDYHLRC